MKAATYNAKDIIVEQFKKYRPFVIKHMIYGSQFYWILYFTL